MNVRYIMAIKKKYTFDSYILDWLKEKRTYFKSIRQMEKEYHFSWYTKMIRSNSVYESWFKNIVRILNLNNKEIREHFIIEDVEVPFWIRRTRLDIKPKSENHIYWTNDFWPLWFIKWWEPSNCNKEEMHMATQSDLERIEQEELERLEREAIELRAKFF